MLDRWLLNGRATTEPGPCRSPAYLPAAHADAGGGGVKWRFMVLVCGLLTAGCLSPQEREAAALEEETLPTVFDGCRDPKYIGVEYRTETQVYGPMYGDVAGVDVPYYIYECADGQTISSRSKLGAEKDR